MNRRALAVRMAVLCCGPALLSAQTPAEVATSRYSVDGMHSTVGFATTLLRAVKVRGRFDDYEATIIYDVKTGRLVEVEEATRVGRPEESTRARRVDEVEVPTRESPLNA